ncbi:MAG: chitobiase/beta-hexosaminidase C-terminal domain-containing protein [Candidatus Omnitrophica bacterium]|jgi:hypothetical protein|nr:chitobiase/beta-hexosaminidase C-terminal domain-containing protein [Candidatus Omnitrophota bacterium]
MSTKTKNPFSNKIDGTYFNELEVNIRSVTDNSTIYYTINGNDPNESSSSFKSGLVLTFSNIGIIILKCAAKGADVINSDGSITTYSLSDVITFTYTIKDNTNFNITETTDNYVETQPNILEPIDDKGAQLYVDLTQFIGEHLKNQDGFMELIYTFQDYLNNGFREIPTYYKTITYSTTNDCGIATNNTYKEYLPPYNHSIDMILDYENNSQNLNNNKDDNYNTLIEKYDRNRDISTFAIDDDALTIYKQLHPTLLTDGVYYGSYRYYNNVAELIKKVTSLYTITQTSYIKSDLGEYFILATKSSSGTYYKTTSGYTSDTTDSTIEDDTTTYEITYSLASTLYSFSVFLSVFDSYKDNNSDLENQFVLKNSLAAFLSTFNGSFTVNVYFCGLTDFANHFTYNGEFTLESTFYPTFYNKFDSYNIEDDYNAYSGMYTKETLLNSNILLNRFRISIKFDSYNESIFESISSNNSPMTIELNMESLNDLNWLNTNYPNYPLLAPKFEVIYEWQSPEVFYNYFSSENEYRVDDKKSTILEKIHKIAYLKDPDVIDFEYIQFVASQMGYNLDIDEDDINDNKYYSSSDDKQNALRSILRNLPNFYKIKCTKNGLEALLLSFGIVGDIVYLYTIGNNTQQGYVDFIDSKLLEGDLSGMYDDADLVAFKAAKINNASLASSVASDWFPSPHFRIEIDLLKQDLRLNAEKMGLKLITKAVKRTKPINTVFQGFYGKMMGNFGYIFVHKPKGMMKGYAKADINPLCGSVDIWDSRCFNLRIA